jgi:hypothetical protein
MNIKDIFKKLPIGGYLKDDCWRFFLAQYTKRRRDVLSFLGHPGISGAYLGQLQCAVRIIILAK